MVSADELIAWSLDFLQRTPGHYALLAELLGHCHVEAARHAGHGVPLGLAEVDSALREGPFVISKDNNVRLQAEGEASSPVRFRRTVQTADVLWIWLGHQNAYNGKLANVSVSLSLTATSRPESLSAQAIVDIVNRDVRQDEEVTGTARLFNDRKWWDVEIDHAVLEGVRTQLQEGDPTGGAASVRLTAWLSHLSGMGPKSVSDAVGHRNLLGKLAEGVDLGRLILTKEPGQFPLWARDGRHRLFAILDHASRTGSRPPLTVLLGR